MGGLNKVLLGPLTHGLFDAAAFRTWASEGAQCGVALRPLYCHGVSGIRGLAFVLKENVRGFGWGRWKGHTQGSWGERGEIKTNRHIRSLSQTLGGYMILPLSYTHRS